MKLRTIIAFSALLLFFALALAQVKNAPFEPAGDFPREALVYVQTSDLPAFIRLWNDSRFAEKYLASSNYRAFQNNHLGRKLASRWEEFSRAAGFSIDLETLGGLAEKRAALAVYDIGKLEFVFIAPVSNELFAATRFVQNQDKFTAQTIDEITIYRTSVEADRGRQKQELIYAHLKEKLVVATSEKLLIQTIGNIQQKGGKNSLQDEPAFKLLSETVSPNAATVWVNQEKLNDDYYFKRYWLMSDVADLENIRAGIFDLAVEKGKLTERRKFLLKNPVAARHDVKPETAKSLTYLPEDIPFYRFRSADRAALDSAVRETLFERQIPEKRRHRKAYYPTFDDFDSNDRDYSALGENFDEWIDDADEEETVAKTTAPESDFAGIMQPANARTVLTFTEPAIQPAPLFVEFHRGAVFNLAAPGALRRDSFEATIAGNFSSRLLISQPGATFSWETGNEGAVSWRFLIAPLLGMKAAYSIIGNELILTNDPEFLKKILAAKNNRNKADPVPPLTELTVVNLDRRAASYDRIFAELAKNSTVSDFFNDNVQSLLEAAPEVKNIEVRKNYSGNFLNEEIVVKLRAQE